ncbi:MAG TPA: cobyric acid synthase CobQ [Desulfobacterales bacterium]|nr:cobyric acid synthase CobQ [Desulfobacterales bacterium]
MKFRPLMILGAGSDVGKSILTAALCRIFRQESIGVAPFKAQNMALNSFITPEGGEMGRAQVVQAQAAGLTPHVDMNPILLKPSSDVGAQVIVQGKVYGNLGARDYYQHKPKLVRKVMESYRRLAASYDLIILEGAGSAVELNLKKNDLVNFSMAKRIGAAVLLVADIDRGGVFAATIGTHHLLTRVERRLLEGFIINKFRGDISLFDSGVKIIERRTGKKVFGVVPYMRDLLLPQEDSVALERKMQQQTGVSSTDLQINILRLPHISNYTDFDPLEQEPGVNLNYFDHHHYPADADLLILPGTKNTIADLLYLHQTGLAEKIRNYAKRGGRVIGICGGFQMMGEVVRDPLGMEGTAPEAEGLGLLPLITTMAGEKTTTQVEARFLGLGEERPLVTGYEIHLGITDLIGEGRGVFEITRRLGQPVKLRDGYASQDFRSWGSYIHGLFDSDVFRRAWLAELRRGKGLEVAEAGVYTFEAFQEEQFDRLAEVVRGCLDVERLLRVIRL